MLVLFFATTVPVAGDFTAVPFDAFGLVVGTGAPIEAAMFIESTVKKRNFKYEAFFLFHILDMLFFDVSCFYQFFLNSSE